MSSPPKAAQKPSEKLKVFKVKPEPTTSPTEIQNSISSLAWSNQASNSAPILSMTSWDGELKLFRLTAKEDGSCSLKGVGSGSKKYQDKDNSLLKSCWSPSDETVFVGDSEGRVRSLKIEKFPEGERVIGCHTKAINSLQYLEEWNVLISTSYSEEIKLWDIRQQQPIRSLNMGSKVACAASNSSTLALALSNYTLSMIDFRKDKELQTIDSPLGLYSPVQSIALHHTHPMVALGGIDGRVSLTLFNPEDNLQPHTSMVENLHQQQPSIDLEGKKHKIGFPVNAVNFSKVHDSWLLSAGSSKQLLFYDFYEKRMVAKEEKEAPVTAVALASDGGCLAYATGNDWHRGKNESWSTKISVRLMTKQDYK